MAPNIAIFTPALEERPPGPPSCSRFSVIRGKNRSGLSSFLLLGLQLDDVDEKDSERNAVAAMRAEIEVRWCTRRAAVAVRLNIIGMFFHVLLISVRHNTTFSRNSSNLSLVNSVLS